MEKLKVFVVDDENIARVTLSDDLKDLGYSVDDYDNPLLALIDINKKKPDIIFTDVRMPEMNGIELLKEIKKINPNIYVIIMTGYSSVSNAVDAVKSGAYDYISKPINIEDIKIKLEQIEKIENLKQEYKTVINQYSENFNLQKIIGISDATKSVIESILIVFSPPTFSNSPSSRTRRSLTCKSKGISSTSSRYKVPLLANSNLPFFSLIAPVKAPFV